MDSAITLRDKVYEFVKIKGVVLPIDIAKEFKLDTLFASALLSELAKSNKVKISYLKVGSSPLYYIPEKKYMLEQYINYLNKKEREAFNMIKEKKLIKDKELEPAMRVALSSLKDFAVLIEVVKPNGESEKYWKFYTLNDQDVINIIKEKESKNDNLIDLSHEKERHDKINLNEKEEKKEQKKEKKEDFHKRIYQLLHENKVIIKREEIIKKNREIFFVLSIPTSFGYIDFCCYCIDKKRLTEQDIALRYVEALNRHMPLLIITTATVNKNIHEKIGKKFKSIIIKSI